MTASCKICGESYSKLCVDVLEYKHNGDSFKIPSVYRECQNCTSEYIGMEESMINKEILKAFKNILGEKK
jgi:HTH-type transcriptional regulator / antitoxin MqsA